jgi:MFS family permease
LLLVPGYAIGGVVGPFAGRFADRRGAVLPATVGLGIQVVSLIAYAQLGLRTPLWIVVVAYAVGAIGAGCFFPSNNSAVMKAAPGDEFGITSGLLRTFANVGMVFSFALAILVASESITKAKAFSIFVGTSSLNASTAAAFTDGIHSAFYSSTVLMAAAAILSASRARGARDVPVPAITSTE